VIPLRRPARPVTMAVARHTLPYPPYGVSGGACCPTRHRAGCGPIPGVPVTVRLKTPWQAHVACVAVGAVCGPIGWVWGYYCGWLGIPITVVYAYFLGAVAGHLIGRRWPPRLEVTL
jgi:hypothetical protein